MFQASLDQKYWKYVWNKSFQKISDKVWNKILEQRYPYKSLFMR